MKNHVLSFARRDPWLAGALEKRRCLHERHDGLIDAYLMGHECSQDPTEAWKDWSAWAAEANALARKMQRLAMQVLNLDEQINARLEEYGVGTSAAA